VPGYLSHLAARSFGSKPAVRPRLPALFEAAPGTPSLGEAESTGLLVVEREVPAPSPSSVMRTTAPAQAEPQANAAYPHAAWAPPQQPPAPASSRQGAAAVEVWETPAPPPRPSESRPQVPVEEQPRAPQRVVVRPEIHSAEPAQVKLQPVPRIAPPATPREAEPQPVVSQQMARHPGVRAEREDAPIDPFHSVREPAPSAAQPLVPMTALPWLRSETQAAQRNMLSAEPAQQEAPSVQVTIGRLIVEAAMPAHAAAPMPSPRTTGPRLSLDDYLRQRRSQA
jgi:hypothetical protein